jgi:hypothetical protein
MNLITTLRIKWVNGWHANVRFFGKYIDAYETKNKEIEMYLEC